MRRCLIADDHPMLRAALSMAVRARWPGAVVIECARHDTALAQADASVDLMLVDLTMPGAEPLAAIAALRAKLPSVPLVVLTGLTDDELMLDILDFGVAGWIPKHADTEVILAAVALVAAGGTYLPPRVGELARTPAVAKPELTARQHDVLKLLVAGQSNKEIARELGITPATVKTHVAQLLAALGAANRTEAFARARAARIL